MPAFLAARATAATLSAPPMLPGLIRTAATPASIARNARLALKWMSAITGIGESRTINGSAWASSRFGTATRTISQPAEASAAICAVVASTSCVFVRVIDWTTTGAPPPIATPPTLIWCVLGIGVRVPPALRRVLLVQSAHRVTRDSDPVRGLRFPERVRGLRAGERPGELRHGDPRRLRASCHHGDMRPGRDAERQQ